MLLKLKVHNAVELDRNVKATLQASGKLGFSDGARKKMDLSADKYIVIATNEEDPEDENLYGWVEPSADTGGFRLKRSGEYYNINMKPLFDQLGVSYKDKTTTTIYDIIEIEHDGRKIFKFNKRVQKKSSRNKKTDDSGD